MLAGCSQHTVSHCFLQWAFEYTITVGSFVSPAHFHCPECPHVLLPKAAGSVLASNLVPSTKELNTWQHKVPAEMGTEQHCILHQREATRSLMGTVIEGNQLLQPHQWGLWEQNESVGKTGDMTHLSLHAG